MVDMPETKLPAGYASVDDAARMLGISGSGVRAAIRAGRVDAFAVGGAYFLEKREVLRYGRLRASRAARGGAA